MTRAERHAYLASREWALLKEQVRVRSGGCCERCAVGDHEQTHHVTYERLGHERLDDLLGVCEACHLYLSGKSDDDPARRSWWADREPPWAVEERRRAVAFGSAR